jgi:ATP-binding cassette subfamily B protein
METLSILIFWSGRRAIDMLKSFRRLIVIYKGYRLSTIRNAHKILVVNGGEIVEIGPHDELMAQKGFYYALYMSQFKGKLPTDSSADIVDFVST